MPLLIAMRHAKAVDRMQAEDDFERGLTERGVADADRAAKAIEGAGLKVTHALVSPARRTRETWKRISATVGEPPVTDPMALYHASPDMLERAIAEQLEAGAEAIMLVGHNPGIGALVHMLAGQAGAVSDLPYGWPTSALAAFEVTIRNKRPVAEKRVLYFNPKDD
jgi:phosphohistidine phosphatase